MRRLAGAVQGRRWLVLSLTAAVLVASVAYGGSVSNQLDPFGFEDPSEERVKALDRIEAGTGVDPEPQIVAVVRGAPISSAAMRGRVARVERLLGRDPAVARAESFYENRDEALVSRDRRAALVVAYMDALPDGEQKEAAKRLEAPLGALPGVAIGGEAAANAQVEDIISEDLQRIELIAFPIVFLLSAWFLRGFVAALIPPLLGALTIAISFALLRLASEVVSLSVFALNLATGLGLGLAIDYSLLIISRFREERASGAPPSAALSRAVGVAGRTVAVSALTVALALASLVVFPQRFLYSMGIAGVIVPIVAATAALVPLTALLAVVGPRVDALSPRLLRRRAERDARPASSGGWYRLAQLVMRRPAAIALASAALLLALGSPFLDARFKQFDARVLPDSAEARQAFDQLETGFAGAQAGPILVAAEAPPERTQRLATQIAALDGVAAVSGPRQIGERRSLIVAVPRSDPLSQRSQHAVREIRSLRTPYEFLVGGESAAQIDQRESIERHLPAALAIAVGATLLILMIATRSLVLPLKQVVMNALTVSAAFGFLVLVFQHGRLESLLGYESLGALELSLPVLIFALVFGLATDYGVFLFARIREARDAGATNEEAVSFGLERTGRIVTAAALLFAVAIGALGASRIDYIKQLGLGTAFAVLIDASLVRALLVPALMRLLGRWNWWLPHGKKRP